MNQPCTIKASQVAVYLTQLMKADRYAVQTLMKFRTSCNDVLAACPHLPVAEIAGQYMVGPLGLINGLLLGLGEQEVVVMQTDAETGKLVGFTTVEYRKLVSDG